LGEPWETLCGQEPRLEMLVLDMPWDSGKFAVVLDGVFSAAECQALIVRSEGMGWVPAEVNVGHGLQLVKKDMRDSDRCIIDDPATMAELWQRIKSALSSGDGSALASLRSVPASVWTPVGLNERMRILRYSAGQFFAPHFDGSFVRRGNDAGGKARGGETSFITCQLYLSEDMEGGATRFSDPVRPSQFVDVVPKVGRVLLFQHDLFHEGAPLSSGTKYCLRTDLMFAPGDVPDREYSKAPIHISAPATPASRNPADAGFTTP